MTARRGRSSPAASYSQQGMRSFPSPIRKEDLHHFVVLGRGNQHSKFPGNLRFYATIDEHMPMYDAATSKFLKSQVVHAIWQSISMSAMIFVRKDKRNGNYVEIDDKDARQKISHAIRYRRHLEGSENDTRSASDGTLSLNPMSESPPVIEDSKSNTTVASNAIPTSITAIFSDEELDSVLPSQFLVGPMTGMVSPNIASLDALAEPFEGDIQEPDEYLSSTLNDECSLAGDLEDFLLESFNPDIL